MSFENIQLTDDQLADLYGKQLVIVEKGDNIPKPETKAAKPTIAPEPVAATAPLQGVTGKNKKQFVWLVEEHYFPYLNDADFQFLGDVLTACKMNMEDIALVNVANNRNHFDELVQQLQPKFIIASGVQVDALPIQPADYRVQEQQGYLLCSIDTLEAIRTDKSKKSKLWLALKQMLGL
ncbi:hypothetical protein [Lacibacter sp.]|uniref:hypothetical protein n=1 Tax=Lacibacter sp. TaxID=1915409 RepID=UPI002B4B818A|nr:hypothetical protein [Lacibacter sp.]